MPVVLDVGKEESPITNKLLQLIKYLAPNESELQRLTGLPAGTHEEVVAAASSLIERGVHLCGTSSHNTCPLHFVSLGQARIISELKAGSM